MNKTIAFLSVLLYNIFIIKGNAMESLSIKPLVIKKDVKQFDKNQNQLRLAIVITPYLDENYIKTASQKDIDKMKSRQVEMEDGVNLSKEKYGSSVCSLCYDPVNHEIFSQHNECASVHSCIKELKHLSKGSNDIYVEIIAPFTAFYDKPNLTRTEKFEFEPNRTRIENIKKIAEVVNSVDAKKDVTLELGTCQSSLLKDQFTQYVQRDINIVTYDGFLYNVNLTFSIPSIVADNIKNNTNFEYSQDIDFSKVKDAQKFVNANNAYQYPKLYQIFQKTIGTIHPLLYEELSIDTEGYKKAIAIKDVAQISKLLKADIARIENKVYKINVDIEEIKANLDTIFMDNIYTSKEKSNESIIYIKPELINLNQDAKTDKVIQFDLYNGEYGPLITKQIRQNYIAKTQKTQIKGKSTNFPDVNLESKSEHPVQGIK